MNRSSVTWAMGLAFFVAGTAHAALQPVAATPENDLLDTSTGLAWIKAASLQEGQQLGYRLATSAEASALNFGAATLSGGIYALGRDAELTSSQQQGITYSQSASMGHVTGPHGENWLAGYAFDGPTYVDVPQPFFNPVTGQMVYPPSTTVHRDHNYLMVGEVTAFADLGDPSVGRSQVLNADGSTSYVCWALSGCYPSTGSLWAPVLASKGEAGLGYFMVRSAVPEAASWATMGLGLLCLGATARRPGRSAPSTDRAG